MTIIEKYYDNGSITIQVDHTVTSSGSNELDNCDEYQTPVNTDEELKTFLDNIDEKYKRLPDIR